MDLATMRPPPCRETLSGGSEDDPISSEKRAQPCARIEGRGKPANLADIDQTACVGGRDAQPVWQKRRDLPYEAGEDASALDHVSETPDSLIKLTEIDVSRPDDRFHAVNLCS